MFTTIKHIFYLGMKEIIGIFRDPLLLALIVYSFTLSVYEGATAETDTIDRAAIAIADEDNSALSKRISDAFIPPMFLKPVKIDYSQMNEVLDQGKYTFVVVFPPKFQEKVLANHRPEVQINVDATRMSQAFMGNMYIQQIIAREIDKFVTETSGVSIPSADIIIRNRYNPNLIGAWQGAVAQLVDSIAMIALILTGAALIRERERGTLEHLLVMPVTSFEIMMSKIWSMSFIVLATTWVSLIGVLHHFLEIPIAGSVWLFMLGVLLNLFAMTSLGIFLACFARDMPQLGILMILVLMPMQILSGASTPYEAMPVIVQKIMLLAPTTYIVDFSRSILFRGGDFSVLWPNFASMAIVGLLYFFVALSRFRKTVAS